MGWLVCLRNVEDIAPEVGQADEFCACEGRLRVMQGRQGHLGHAQATEHEAVGLQSGESELGDERVDGDVLLAEQVGEVVAVGKKD